MTGFRWLPPPAMLCGASIALATASFAGGYVAASKSGGLAGLTSSSALALFTLGVALAAVAACGLLVVAWRRSATDRRGGFWLPLGTSGAVVAVALAVAEIGLRALATPTPLGLKAGDLDLLPYDWQRVREVSRGWLDRVRNEPAVFDAEDAELGWNVAPGRRSRDGRYATSAEGLRSREPGQVLSAVPAARRVALVGDSFTFGEEVSFDETWGQLLAGQLRPGTQVLNFGVPGHGIDQTLLKYRRDVRPWRPAVVIVSFLSASPLRNVAVYQFLRPVLELPFSKPRFRLENGALVLLNFPAESPESLLGRPTVWDLPHIDQDSEFEARHWQKPLLDGSYVARYLAARYPRWTPRRQRFPDDGIVALGSRLIRELVAEIRAGGAEAIVVSLPVRSDLTGGAGPYLEPVVRDLARSGVAVFDMAPCLTGRLDAESAFVAEATRRATQRDPGPAHYSPAGNAAVAACLRPLVTAALGPRD